MPYDEQQNYEAATYNNIEEGGEAQASPEFIGECEHAARKAPPRIPPILAAERIRLSAEPVDQALDQAPRHMRKDERRAATDLRCAVRKLAAYLDEHGMMDDGVPHFAIAGALRAAADNAAAAARALDKEATA